MFFGVPSSARAGGSQAEQEMAVPFLLACALRWTAVVEISPAGRAAASAASLTASAGEHLTEFGYYYGLSPRDGFAGFANHSTTTFVLNGPGSPRNMTALALADIADLRRLQQYNMRGILYSVQAGVWPAHV